MKTRFETRMECVRLANTLAQARVIPREEVLTYAGDLFAWVDESEGREADVTRLSERFKVR